MKRLPCLLALALCMGIHEASAILFYGTLTETITDTTDPNYAVGQTFFGWYQYESPSVDGTFIASSFVLGGNSRSTLVGELWPGTSAPRTFYAYFEPYTCSMTVSNGLVADFKFGMQEGLANADFWETGFRFSLPITPFVGLYYTNGTVEFSAPTSSLPAIADVSSVPEGLSTLWLLPVCIGLVIARRKA